MTVLLVEDYKKEMTCIRCNKLYTGSYEYTVVYDPKRPKGVKKKNYRIGIICPNCGG
jgi:transcription elongation factor Elf1